MAIAGIDRHGAGRRPLPSGAVVVTCLSGSGRYHEATAGHVARVCAMRVPDVILIVDRGSDARPAVRGGSVPA